jgi:hypothetical protein
LEGTISGNQALGGPESSQNGGGSENQAATMTISNTTISGNTSIGGARGTGGSSATRGEGAGDGIMNVFDADPERQRGRRIIQAGVNGRVATGWSGYFSLVHRPELRPDDYAKAGITVSAPRLAKSARRAPARLDVRVVRATAEDTTRGIAGDFVRTPLEDVAQHVMEAPRVRFEVRNGSGEWVAIVEREKHCRIGVFAELFAQGFIRNIGIALEAGRGVAGEESGRRASATGVLPLGLGGEPDLLPGLLA